MSRSITKPQREARKRGKDRWWDQWYSAMEFAYDTCYEGHHCIWCNPHCEDDSGRKCYRCRAADLDFKEQLEDLDEEELNPYENYLGT